VTFEYSARRLIVVGAFVSAVAAAPAVAYFAVPSAAPSAPTIAACPAGETEDLFTDNCVPEMAPNVPGGNFPTPEPGGVTFSTPGDVNSLPEVSGIPCTGRNSGECIGLEEEQANVPDVTPHSSLSSSP
jgi:hypothetical protein